MQPKLFQLTKKIILFVNVTVYLAHLNALYTHLNTFTSKNGYVTIKSYVILKLDFKHV